MSFDIFEEYLSNNLKINDDKIFQEKIDLLLSSNTNKKKLLIKKEKEKEKLKREELKNKKKIKDQSNEKKIDFILSDEKSFEKYERKLKEKEEEKDDDDINDINDIFSLKNKKQKETASSNIANTEILINKENKLKEAQFIEINNDIKKDKSILYNPKRIKKEKEINYLKTGLQDDSNNKTKKINNDSAKGKVTNNNIKKNIFNEIT